MNPIAHPPATRPSVMHAAPILLLSAGAWLLADVATGGEPPRAPALDPILHPASGGDLPGRLADSDRPGTIRWRSAAFADPFEFPLDAVDSVRFPVAEVTSRPVGAFGIELAGGDVVFGSLAGLDDKVAELELARLGKIRVDRARIRRIFRWRDGADLVYNGPNGLAGWREAAMPRPRLDRAAKGAAEGVNVIRFGGRNAGKAPAPAPAEPPAPKWREESGQLLTDREGACVRGDFGIPARSSIEFELSWKENPDFILALGIGEDEESVQQSFRFEVWDGQLVAYREAEDEGDLAPIRPVGAGPGRIHLQVFLDQGLGRLLVFSANGEPVADLKVGARPGPALPGLLLASRRGKLRLERLRIGRWDSETPSPTHADGSRIQLSDGSMERRSLDRLDPATGEFVVRDEGGESRIVADQIVDVRLAGPEAGAPPAVRAVYQDGTRLGGDWVKAEAGALILAAPGIATPLRLPVEGMRALEFARRDRETPKDVALLGTLEMDGLRLSGRLAGSGEAGVLAWQPTGSENAGRFLPAASGRLIYRTSAPPSGEFRRPTTSARPRPAARAGLVGVIDALQQSLEGGAPARPSGSDKKFLYLRTGDIVPATITKVDEAGVTFRSDYSENTFVPNERVKAIEMAAEVGAAIRVSKAKRERLLTVPRMQRDSPPTHLIRSRNGDFLRGRVIGMDDKSVRVEVRMEEKEIPRERVSRIIWFHADETDPSRKPAEPAEPPSALRVQAIRSDGIRMTFAVDRVADNVLLGKSEVLGPCKVRLQDLDQLLIGGAVEKEATQLAYQQWKLQNAPEPRSARDGDSGTESALVGKPAPDFTLDLLGGRKFHLAESKGKIVILDFWATWCGPCLQAMPQTEQVAREFAGQGVELVAVNLQEAPAQISAMLERQKLSPAVALDRDGVVAEKYGATAIPQTVVVDREGVVKRMFVGGGPHLDDRLREALKALMPAAAP